MLFSCKPNGTRGRGLYSQLLRPLSVLLTTKNVVPAIIPIRIVVICVYARPIIWLGILDLLRITAGFVLVRSFACRSYVPNVVATGVTKGDSDNSLSLGEINNLRMSTARSYYRPSTKTVPPLDERRYRCSTKQYR